jgi:outer membrane protein TolC
VARVDDLLAQAQGDARVAEAALAFRLGEAETEGYRLAPLAPPAAPAGAVADWQQAAATRSDLEAARARLVAGELEARALQGALWPRVGLLARQEWSDDRLFGSHGDATSVYAAATFELFDGGRRRAAVGAARAEAEAGRQDVARFAEGVRLEVRQAWEAAASALARRETAAAALAAAAEALRIVEERFGAGVLKTLDVLDAATARREAEMRELVARAEARLAVLRLAFAAGRPPETALAAATPTPLPGELP